jgi:hypothetical protein
MKIVQSDGLDEAAMWAGWRGLLWVARGLAYEKAPKRTYEYVGGVMVERVASTI